MKIVDMQDNINDIDVGRDSWCTPKWLTDLIGDVDIDPCSNDRSHVQSLIRWSLPVCGLTQAPGVASFMTVFVNPPYSRGCVQRWVDAYKHTNFMFLLRMDPSTQWFRSLMQLNPYVWFAHERINFEPPPGVQASSNPFPHGLFCRSLPNKQLLKNGFLLKNI